MIKLLITIKNFQIKRVNVETSIEVVIENVSRSIDMGPSMSRKLHHGVVSKRTVLHALREPEELAEPLIGVPCRHVWGVPVTDIEDSAIAVHFPAIRYQSDVSASEWAVAGVGAGDCGIGCGGEGESGDSEHHGAE